MIDSTGPAWDAIVGLSRFAALAAMAELDCAEHLASGPMGVPELAKACDAHEPSLARLLRELETIGVVRSVAPETYELTEEGQTLRDGVPGSMRSALRMAAEPGYWYAMGNLAQTVRDGRSAFIARFGPLYGYLQERPEAARLFNEYMAIRAAPLEAALATTYDFTGVKTFVDIAGGTGHLLAAVLERHPDMRGVLFDIAHVVENGRAAMTARGLADRCEFEGGDFFESVPMRRRPLSAGQRHPQLERRGQPAHPRQRAEGDARPRPAAASGDGAAGRRHTAHRQGPRHAHARPDERRDGAHDE